VAVGRGHTSMVGLPATPVMTTSAPEASLPRAEVRVMANAGHAPFWNNSAEFNDLLRRFCQTL
jgi:pimeloyl-ACP methyl ester carboxylesterase